MSKYFLRDTAGDRIAITSKGRTLWGYRFLSRGIDIFGIRTFSQLRTALEISSNGFVQDIHDMDLLVRESGAGLD